MSYAEICSIKKSSTPPRCRTNLLMLRRRTNVTKILNNVAQPKRAIPVNASPEFKALPFDSMIPIFKGPGSQLIFSRNKVGREIFASAGTEFDLSDPYCHTVSYDYQQLHDHNLKHVFAVPKNLKHLKAINMITEDKEVRCTLKQFNEYRRYLKRLYLNKVNIVRAQNDENEIDKRNVMLSERIADKFLIDCVRREAVLKKRKEFQLRQRNAAAEQKANFARLQEHYRQTAARFERIQEKKREAVQQKSRQKIMCAKERQHHMYRMEKRRVVLLRRKFTLERRIVPKRMQLHRMQANHAKELENQQTCHRRGLYRSQRQWQDNQLLNDTEVQTKSKVEKRQRMVAKMYDRDLQKITLKRADFIRSRYQQRNAQTISTILFEEIGRMVRLQQKADLEHQRRVHEDQLQSRAQIQLESTKNSVEPSPNVSFVSGDSVDQELKTFMRRVLGSERRIITEKGAPFEPQQLSAVGLNDFVSGYAALTKNKVRAVVNADFTTALALRGCVTTMDVLMAAHQTLDRISKGHTIDIPHDTAVQAYVEFKVKTLLETVRLSRTLKIISMRNSLLSGVSSKSTDCLSIFKVMRTRSLTKRRRSRKVTFGAAKVHSVSTVELEDELCQNCVNTTRRNERVASVRQMARAVLQMPTLDVSPEIPIDMQEQKLAHLYDFQKIAILTNLERFQSCLEYEVDANMLKNFDVTSLKFDCRQFAKYRVLQEHELIEMVMDTVLKLPEKDLLFSKRVIMAAYSICMAVVFAVQPTTTSTTNKSESSTSSVNGVRVLKEETPE